MTPPAATAAARAGTRARPQRSVAPRVPRRVSGPAPVRARPQHSRPERTRTRSARRAPAQGVAAHVVRGLRALPDLGVLDRLIRGRFWIGLVAVALMGIVAMQVAVLKLNTGIGRAIEHVSSLQRDNSALQADVSQLSSGDRIEAEGYRMGMVMAPAGDVRFLTASRWDAYRASHRIGPPAPGLAAAAASLAASSSTSAASTANATSTAPTLGSGSSSSSPSGSSPGSSSSGSSSTAGSSSGSGSASASPATSGSSTAAAAVGPGSAGGSGGSAGSGGSTSSGGSAASTGSGNSGGATPATAQQPTNTGGGTGAPMAAAAAPTGP